MVWRWMIGRTFTAAGIVIAVVTLTFFAIRWAPGEPFLPSDERPLAPSVEAALRRQYGLDQPIGTQYFRYLRALGRGDLGESFFQHRPGGWLVGEAISPTVFLGVMALGLGFLLGIAMGS